jgi:MoaA/NifB/PqqE/SkfB family radical SAM enzyme
MIPPLLRRAWYTTDVIISRYLGISPRYMPVMVMFVTGLCNLRCRMCGVCDLERGHVPQEELTTAQWKSVIKSSTGMLGTSLAAISGGEPLLRPDLFEIISYATECGMAIHLCTNAVLLNKDNIISLRDSGVSTVSISLESPDSKIHDYLRGDNTFPMAVKSIRNLHEFAPDVNIGINYLVTRLNYKRMTEMVPFVKSLGVNQIKFAPIHTNLLHRRKALEEYSDLLFREKDIEDLKNEVHALKILCKKNKMITNSNAFLDGISTFYSSPKPWKCYAGYAICAVSPTGSVAPCCDKDSHFNVKDRPLDEIWNDREFHNLRQQIHTCNVPCWDTTYTELSLFLRPLSLLGNVVRNIRDINFYYK